MFFIKNKKNNSISGVKKFGMFEAVYTPSILTILGVIMYQRLGWIVGEAGLVKALGIIFLAHVISIATGLSIASIATNRTVKAGGNYYIISRSLGLSIGGAIGVAFYLALTISIALYLIGFAESFNGYIGLNTGIWWLRIVAIIALILLTILTFISTSLALKSQYFILVAIVLSIVSLFLGTTGDYSNTTGNIVLWANKSSTQNFEMLFAIFFPAVTGFTAGVNMSGDLKNPKKAIPKGTILSIITGMLVYIIIAIYLSYFIDSDFLRNPENQNGLWYKISKYPLLVAFGVWGATISSALGSILGAARTLQALAFDGVVPKFFGKGRGELNEPTYALFLTVAIAITAIILGELDFIARILTMAFLTVYAFISLSYAIESWANNPAFRPTFKVPYQVGLIGALVSFLIMFKLDMLAMIAATLFMALIYFILKRKRFHVTVDDTWVGFWSAFIRFGLIKLKSFDEQKGRNWRPNLVLMGGDPEKRKHLIEFARSLVQNSGIITYFNLIKGKIIDKYEDFQKKEKELTKLMNEKYPEVFVKNEISEDIYEGIKAATQSYGIPGMTSNTVLMGWVTKINRSVSYSNMLLDLILLNKNLLLLDVKDSKFGLKNSIDIWWGGLEHNGILMLTITNLLKSSNNWAKARVRLIMIVHTKEQQAEAQIQLKKVIKSSNLDGNELVILKENDKTIIETITDISKMTNLTILGMRKPDLDDKLFISNNNKLAKNLNTVLFVKGSDDFNNDYQVVFQEEHPDDLKCDKDK